MTENLQFKSHAMTFAWSSTGNKPVLAKEKWDKTSKNLKDRVKSSLVVKILITCVIDVRVSHTIASRIRIWARNVTPKKKCDTLQKCAKVNLASSSFIWTELGSLQLDGKIRRLEAFEGHKLTRLGSLTCDVEWNESNYKQQQLGVVQSELLFGRDIIPQEGINTECDEKSPSFKGYKAHVKLIPGPQLRFCKAGTIPLSHHDRLNVKFEMIVRQSSLSQFNLVESKEYPQ